MAIEVKEPNNKLKARQEIQLFSYMKQLELRIGLYIGEKWQLYYNAPDDKENPHVILSAPLIPNIEAGAKLCQLLTYESYSLEAIETFCMEQLRCLRNRKEIQNKLASFNYDDQGITTLLKLLREKLLVEGAIPEILDEEMSQIKICYEYGKVNKTKCTKTKEKKEKKKLQKYSLNGGPAMFMSKIALESLRLYVKRFPNATFAEIEKKFPKTIVGGRAMVRKISELEELQEAGSKEMERYSWTPNERLRSSDNIEFVVCTEWHVGNFPNLIKVLKELKWSVKAIK